MSRTDGVAFETYVYASPCRCEACGSWNQCARGCVVGREFLGHWSIASVIGEAEKLWLGGHTPLFLQQFYRGDGSAGVVVPTCGACGNVRGFASVGDVLEMLETDAGMIVPVPNGRGVLLNVHWDYDDDVAECFQELYDFLEVGGNDG
ncbi:Hsp33 family molecular chaperone HslO [Aeoliella mucimassa]|uniref:Uncharacterized protein n=1 Tax=Aeoliella mucimassa TaxID=2527972 RepID=A0A518AUF7_9BACT|nr:Hsp33 family molecular chaperone HslO [Aeoliella mucimassa]QDU58335.1 hypothetical protein Pan181_45690 [Aeoliella mucimassa]